MAHDTRERTPVPGEELGEAPWLAPRSALEIALAFLNTWDLLAHPPELLRGPDALRRFLEWIGRPASDKVTDADVKRAIAARERLRQAFDAPSEEEAVARLNDLLLKVGGVPQLVSNDGSWQVRYTTRRPEPTAGLLAESAGGLLAAMQDGLWGRLGRCEGDPCRCAFVDRTKNRVRRFCSTICSDRMMQAAFRRRRRLAARESRIDSASSS